MQQLRPMTVHAHPDDESSKGAATIARAAAEGADVLVVACTGGERGDVLNPALNRPDIRGNLTRIRREEMAAACDILGVRQHFLGFVDSGLPGKDDPLPDGCFARQPVEKAARPLVELIGEFRPQVIVTYDETGGYPHPDHIRTREVTMAAFEATGDPERYPGTGDPWQPSKLYHHCALRREWFQALHDAMTERGIESPMGAVLEERPTARTCRPSPPESSARTTSKSETEPYSHMPRKPAATIRSSLTPEHWNAKSGPPRTTTWRDH
jgi:mycothiol S-conjugate amidase